MPFGQSLLGGPGGYDIIVGTQAQIDANQATHLVSTFVAALLDGNKVLILDGTHALAQNEDITETDVVVESESPQAIIDFQSFTLTISGARSRASIRGTNVTTNAVIISAAGGYFMGLDIDINDVVVSNGAKAECFGTPSQSGTKAGQVFGQGGGIISFGNVVVFQELVKTDLETIINTSTNQLNYATNHTFISGLAVKFTQATTIATTDAPQIIASTILYVKDIDSDTIELYRESSLSTIVDFSDDGTGDITISPQFIVPAGVTRVWAEVYGPAGGGGRGDTTHTAGGGGAGGVSEGFLTVTPGEAMPVVVGKGGVVQSTISTAGNNGSADTTFSTLTGAFGTGGNATGRRNGGLGGISTGGDINMAGQAGGSGQNPESGDLVSAGGHGGSNKRGGGGRGGAQSLNASSGGTFGGGGGGGGGNTPESNGAKGGNGGVIIWY